MTKETYLIATSGIPKSQESFDSMCKNFRGAAKEGGLEITSGIIWTDGFGCSNVAFEVTGDTTEAERLLDAITMALMPARWSNTADKCPDVDTWENKPTKED